MTDRILNIQHHFNPLHVYCRLVERGVSKRLSMSICRYYELLIYSWLGWLSVAGVQICKAGQLALLQIHRNSGCFKLF
ncbi:MAG: hypothetical protein KAJ90_06225 [Desulfobacterales bacterium]|nr:hypothetical protein [Desulfobacterales bacterium]